MKSLFYICLFILSFTTLSLKTAAQSDTLSFLHISDLHLIFHLDIYQQNLVQSRKHFGQGIEPLKHFLQTMPEKTHSKFIVATGDLVDFFEGETPKGEMFDFQIEQFSQLLGSANVPVFLNLGNHDITSYFWKDTIRASNQNHAGTARAAWIRNVACFKDGTYYSRVFEVNGTSYRLIFLDNGYNTVHQGENSVLPYIDKAQLHWLEDQLTQSANDIEIILMHVPFTAVVAKSGSSSELYNVMAKNSSAKLILDGHNHKNIVQHFISTGDKKIIQVQTGSFGQNIENWRLIRLTKNNILISFPGKTETELKIPTKN